MSQTLLKLAADFATTLTSAVAVGATSATLTSATDSDGVALPTGTYGLTIDRKNSSKEYIKCTLTSTALTNIYSVSRQGALTSGFARSHRKGAEVIISDFAAIKKINDVLDGTTDLDSGTPLKYDGTATISNVNHLATKAYVDGIAIGGSPDATTSTKGITTMSVAPASAATPIAVGDNDPRVPTQDENNALVGTSGSPSTSNKFVTNDDTATAATASKVARRLAGGNITVVTESANNNTTNAASTAYVDATLLAFKNGTATKDISEASGAQNIAHGLGKTPKQVKITAYGEINANGNGEDLIRVSNAVYNGTTQSSLSFYETGTASEASIDTTFTLSLSGGNTQVGVVTFDATNIIITWTKSGTPTGTYTLLWEAIG